MKPKTDAAFAMIAEALASRPLIEAEIDDVSEIPDILAAELDRLASLTDDELLDEYTPPDMPIDEYLASLDRPFVEDEPTRGMGPEIHLPYWIYWNKPPF